MSRQLTDALVDLLIATGTPQEVVARVGADGAASLADLLAMETAPLFRRRMAARLKSAVDRAREEARA